MSYNSGNLQEFNIPPKPDSKSIFWDRNLQIIFGITLSAVMGVSSITPAFPKISRVLEVDSHQVGWLITVFTIPGIFLTPILGMLADRFGRKKILAPSLFVYSIFGTLCAFTHNFHILLLFRFFQGMGGASLGALNVTLIGDLYQGKQRTEAMGYNAGILSVGTALYPAIGGALAIIGWNFPFFLSLLVLPMGFIVLFKLKNPEPLKEQKITDYIRDIGKHIRSKRVWGLFTANFLTFVMLYGGILTFFPILTDQQFGSSSFVIGLLISASSVVTGICSSFLGTISKRISESTLIRISALCYAAVFLMLPNITNFWWLFAPIVVFGFAQGINMPSSLTLLTRSAPMEYRAAFMSFNWMMMRLGQAIGPILLGFGFKLFGLGAPFYTAFGIALLMFGMLVVFVKKQ